MRPAGRMAGCVVATLLVVAPIIEAQGRGQGQGQGSRTVEGTLEVYNEDSVAGTRLVHILDTGNERIPLKLGKDRKHLLSGSRIRARGAMMDGTLMLDPASGGSGSSVETMALASPFTFGAQSTLVILFNFTDLTTEPYTPASAESVTFTEANDFHVENSYGQTSLGGVVVGWFTIAASTAGCKPFDWARLADTAAATAGVTLSAFPRRVYGFPETSACPWWGLGTVGGGTPFFPSRAWINGPFTRQAVAHELGHNFGAYHSRSLTCDSGECIVTEYGDDHDIMGAAVSGHLNAYQKERLGWLGYGSSPLIETVNASGDYTIESYAAANGGLPKALKMLWTSDPGPPTSNIYIYAEARTQVGADSTLAPGVIIHAGIDTLGPEIYELDLQPETPTIDFILDPGQSITFEGAFTITTVSSDVFGAVLAVTDLSAGSPTDLVPAAATGPYGGTTTLSASLTAGGSPVVGGSVNFTLNGVFVGSATTDSSGTATVSNVILAGFSATTYPTGTGASFAGDGTYEPSTGTSSLTITQKPVSPLFIAADKIYDRSTLATLTFCTVSDIVGADEVGCIDMVPPTFASSDVGSGITVTATDLTLVGAEAGNYTLVSTTATTTASITALAVTPAVTAADKPYDGTTSAALTSCTLSGVLGSDMVGCTGTATFASANSGSQTVAVSGLTLIGTEAGNYTLASTTATTTASITALPVTPEVTAGDKPYDGTTTAALTSCTVSGALDDEEVACTGTATFASAHIGPGQTVTVSGLTLTGAAAGNYTLASTTATTTASIRPPSKHSERPPAFRRPPDTRPEPPAHVPPRRAASSSNRRD